MTPLTLKLEVLPRRAMPRFGGALRRALAVLREHGMLDSIRVPAGLSYPVGTRARRLMRSARIAGG